jgi:hypothetical protein
VQQGSSTHVSGVPSVVCVVEEASRQEGQAQQFPSKAGTTWLTSHHLKARYGGRMDDHQRLKVSSSSTFLVHVVMVMMG